MGSSSKVFLVFGGSGRTGQYFVNLALNQGHEVRMLARTPEKVTLNHPKLSIQQGSTSEQAKWEPLVKGSDFVIVMLGDAEAQAKEKVNFAFIKALVPLMRDAHVRRLLYQAGGFSRHHTGSIGMSFWILRNVLARAGGLLGQHEDNDAVSNYLFKECEDIEWVVHRAGINGDGPSKGTLKRDANSISLAPYVDTARYNLMIIQNDSAVHTSDMSSYP